jgi:hypothetical protein
MNRDMESDPFEAEDEDLTAKDDERGEDDAPFGSQDIENEAERNSGTLQKTKKRGWAFPLVGFLILISFLAGAMAFRANGASDSQNKISPDAEITSVISLAAPQADPREHEVKPQAKKLAKKVPSKPTKPLNEKRREKKKIIKLRLPEPSKEELLGRPGENKNETLKENKQETPITAKPTSKEKPKEANTKKELKKQISDIEKEQLVDKEFEIRLAINELLSRK